MNHGGTQLVATITRLNDGTHLCRYAFGNESVRCDNTFEVFMGPDVHWASASGGSVPRGAIHIGGQRDHYIGRVSPARNWEIGTVDRHSRALIFSGEWRNHFIGASVRNYQVLCRL